MKYTICHVSTLIFALLLNQTVFANSAQPGIFEAGGAGTLSLLYPEDPSAFERIRMVKENVSVLLYPHYAVIRGEYWLKNESADTLNITTGYPINSMYETKGGDAHSIWFDSLYALRVRVNGREVDLELSELDDNWYVWNTEYLPGANVQVEVYFIVNTAESNTREGYSNKRRNGFMYLLETGAHWKPPIGEGNVCIALRGGVKAEDIFGVLPDSSLKWNATEGLLRYTFRNLFPTPEHNIVLTYGDASNAPPFADALINKDKLFVEVDALATQELNSMQWQDEPFGDPTQINEMGEITKFLIGVLVGFIVLVGLIVFLVIYLIKKSRRRTPPPS